MAVGSGVMEMLKDDHEKAKKLFEDFEAAPSAVSLRLSRLGLKVLDGR